MAKKRLTKEELERVKGHAKVLYTREGVTLQKELAQRVGVSENTISAWIREEKWDKLKKNFLLTREEIMGGLLDELEEIKAYITSLPKGQRYADSKLADVRRKITKDIKELETDANKEEIIHAIMKLINFVRPENLQDAKTITHWGDIFIKSLL